MDGKAYADPKVWKALLDETGYNTIRLRDKRYDLVLHLVTAAEGAENFYSKESNVARYETPEEAR